MLPRIYRYTSFSTIFVKPSFFQILQARSRPKFFSSIAAHRPPLSQIIMNPLAKYREYANRLTHEGMLAPFPEFKEPVNYLRSALQTPEIRKMIKENKALELQHTLVQNSLLHITFDFRVE